MATRRKPHSLLHCPNEGRCSYAPRTRRPTLAEPRDVVAFLREQYPEKLDREVFTVILLDARDRVIRFLIISVGTITVSLV